MRLWKKKAQLELKARAFGLGDFSGDTYPMSKKLRKKLHDEVKLEDNGMHLNIPILDGSLASSYQQIHYTGGDVSYIVLILHLIFYENIQ